MKKVIIIGGGISGLATAWLLRAKAQAAGKELEISLLDLELGLVDYLLQRIKANPGQCDLTIRLRDPDESYSLGLVPRKVRVNPSGFALAVRELDSIDLWINGNRVVKEILEKDIPEIE